MRTNVISGINLFEGGPLSVYHDCLSNIINLGLNKDQKFILFVSKLFLFDEFKDTLNFEFIELPLARRSYLFRLWYEYIFFYKYSLNRNIDVWISLHDITPNVLAKRRYVYCHNPSPFLKTNLTYVKFSLRVFLFSFLYRYLYSINIKRNKAVIVQQDWIRDEFIKMFRIDNVIVARPSTQILFSTNNYIRDEEKKIYEFIYPVFPRFFKNFEVIGSACQILLKRGITNFEVLFTIDGLENKYSKYIFNKFNQVDNIKFIGSQSRDKIYQLYEEVDCLIFSSVLETWGLPISEFKLTQKPIILVNLPYAYETIGNYDKASFFSSNNPVELANIMEKEINRVNRYIEVHEAKVKEPYCEDWKKLLERIYSL